MEKACILGILLLLDISLSAYNGSVSVPELAQKVARPPSKIIDWGIRLPLLLKMWHGQAHCMNVFKAFGFPSAEDTLRELWHSSSTLPVHVLFLFPFVPFPRKPDSCHAGNPVG